MLNGILPSFSHGEEGEVLDAGDTWEYLYILNHKWLISAALDPDVAQGKRSFLAGRLAVLHPRGFNRSRQCVAAAVAGLDVQQSMTIAVAMQDNRDGSIFHRKLPTAGEDPCKQDARMKHRKHFLSL